MSVEVLTPKEERSFKFAEEVGRDLVEWAKLDAERKIFPIKIRVEKFPECGWAVEITIG